MMTWKPSASRRARSTSAVRAAASLGAAVSGVTVLMVSSTQHDTSSARAADTPRNTTSPMNRISNSDRRIDAFMETSFGNRNFNTEGTEDAEKTNEFYAFPNLISV